ncbi:MAG: N-acetylmuramoyl-L-alanine amidase [Oscillospiraceae bacterium]|nr:N-acetylmuramoyl-L-alanine amidase [Oscillospiraceae bacterium]
MRNLKICLDPGHDKGYNPSPCGFGYAEGTKMFFFATMLKAALEKYGIEVVLTRRRVEDNPDLFQRAQYGEGCDVLLSLHSNAVGDNVNESVDYVRVYYPISGKEKELASALTDTIAEVMDTRQAPQYLTRINSNGTADYYGIIRHSATLGVPALILEHSFHTNSRSTKWLMSDANLMRLATAEAKTIASHYGLKMIKEESEVRYNTLADLKAAPNSQHYLPTVEKLIAKGYLNGKGGSGDDLILDFSEDSIRILVTLDRAGAYGE